MRPLHKGPHPLRRQRHGQQADLERVLPEDVAERRRDDRLEAPVLQRPWRVLARRAAAEIAPGEQDARVLGVRAVQLEVRVLAPVEEEELAEAGALDPSEKLLRNDLIVVD